MNNHFASEASKIFAKYVTCIVWVYNLERAQAPESKRLLNGGSLNILTSGCFCQRRSLQCHGLKRDVTPCDRLLTAAGLWGFLHLLLGGGWLLRGPCQDHLAAGLEKSCDVKFSTKPQCCFGQALEGHALLDLSMLLQH